MKRSWIALALLVLMSAGLLAADRVRPELDRAEWEHYKARFITPEGRVRDTANGDISHSESQGYALVLATAYDDPETFEQVWAWTEENLGVRRDRLFAWRWDPRAAAVTDPNSAADGDLLIAWALLRAADRWDRPDYAAEARGIAHDVLEHLVVVSGGDTVLLPGPEGFVHGVPTVNLSYWLFPAFGVLDRHLPTPVWAALEASGIELLERARFGRHRLPPDWLALDQPPQPSHLFPPDYGYNAVRIPLHLVWAGIDAPALLEPFVDLARAFDGRPPATIDVLTGETARHPASAGVLAIHALTEAVLAGEAPVWPAMPPDAPYFAWSLYLLAKVADAERTTS